MRHRQPNGSLLIYLFVAVALVVIAVFLGLTSLGQYSKKQGKPAENKASEKQLLAVQETLKKKLEGTRSFQNLAFRIPSLPGLQSIGAGFAVAPGADFQGKSSPDNDRIFIATKTELASSVKLAQEYALGVLVVTTSDPPANLSDLFKVGDFMVLSSPQSSEMLRVVEPLMTATTSAVTVDASKGSFAPTFQEPANSLALAGSYHAEDPVLKADIISLGMNVPTGELVEVSEQTGTVTTLEKGVSQFQVAYSLSDRDDYCKGLMTRTGTFSRADWARLNSDGNGNCYRRIQEIRLDFRAGGAAGSYLFHR